jgi:hypothetical protein
MLLASYNSLDPYGAAMMVFTSCSYYYYYYYYYYSRGQAQKPKPAATS